MQQKEAKYYIKNSDDSFQCLLCPHNCIIKQGKTGICNTRKNTGSELITSIYGEVTAIALDPVEKKPLYHFLPGTQILSIGTKGCNFKCSFCQNWHISQDINADSKNIVPEDIIQAAVNNKSGSIAYTYSEPVIWYEYVTECSELAHKNNIKNVYVTNGFINPDPLQEMLENADAMNIDLKSFRNETYKKITGGRLKNVLETIEAAHKKCHVELTTLIVTGINDDIREIKDIIQFIKDIDPDIPWHISRYHPSYKYNEPATDIGFIMKVYEEACKELNYVYCGNIPSSYKGSDTKCPSCGTVLITRTGYNTVIESMNGDKCGNCGHKIAGIF